MEINRKQVARHEKSGGFCRIMERDRIRKFIFCDIDEAKKTIRHYGTMVKSVMVDRPLRIPIPAPRVDCVKICSQRKIFEHPLEEKLNVLDHYLFLIHGFKAIVYAKLRYREEYVTKYFANCAGSFIEQEQQSAFCLIELFLENSRWAVDVINSCHSFDDMKDQQARVESLGRFAESIGVGEAVVKGRYTVILEPQLAGAVIHETVGHISEADNALRSATLKRDFQIGNQVGSPILCIVDDSALPGLPGSYVYDDEGVAGSRTTLISEGRVVGKLHTLRTAQLFETDSTGNARAVDFRSEPIVRCSNTLVLPGETAMNTMIDSIRDGLYLRGVRGGRTFGDWFIYQVGGGFRITNGRIATPIRNLRIRGRVLEFLRNIVGVGNLLPQLHSPFCLKKGQAWLPVWSGSPALKVENVPIEV